MRPDALRTRAPARPRAGPGPTRLSGADTSTASGWRRSARSTTLPRRRAPRPTSSPRRHRRGISPPRDQPREQVVVRQRRHHAGGGDQTRVRGGGPARPQTPAHLGRAGGRRQPPDRADQTRGSQTRAQAHDRRRLRARLAIPVGGRGLPAPRQRTRPPSSGCTARRYGYSKDTPARSPAPSAAKPPTPAWSATSQTRRRSRQLPDQQVPLPRLPHRPRNGWPIATGIVEGACRHLVKDRMDITGARWGLAGAEAILKLRALKANGDFEQYWRYHLNQERHHVHQARYDNHTIPAT